MHSRQLTNRHFDFHSPIGRLIIWLAMSIACLLVLLSPKPQQVLLSLLGVASLLLWGYYLAKKSTVSFTLTATHLQQHLFHGGWVLKWSNISKIGLCTYDNDGWQQPLPWVGIKIKNYPPYLESICPRIITDVLLNQRVILYLGAKQCGKEKVFEDYVLDGEVYRGPAREYTGLQAMLANRMKHQREFHDYDIFIAVADLDRTGEDFVGLARRYLAAAETEPDCY